MKTIQEELDDIVSFSSLGCGYIKGNIVPLYNERLKNILSCSEDFYCCFGLIKDIVGGIVLLHNDVLLVNGDTTKWAVTNATVNFSIGRNSEQLLVRVGDITLDTFSSKVIQDLRKKFKSPSKIGDIGIRYDTQGSKLYTIVYKLEEDKGSGVFRASYITRSYSFGDNLYSTKSYGKGYFTDEGLYNSSLYIGNLKTKDSDMICPDCGSVGIWANCALRCSNNKCWKIFG